MNSCNNYVLVLEKRDQLAANRQYSELLQCMIYPKSDTSLPEMRMNVCTQ